MHRVLDVFVNLLVRLHVRAWVNFLAKIFPPFRSVSKLSGNLDAFSKSCKIVGVTEVSSLDGGLDMCVGRD
jgi:hypothetical protein